MNTKKILLVLSLSALTATAFLQTGCVAIETDRPQPEVQTTVGRELIDLKLALEDGAISEDEYLEQKDKILNRE